MEGEWSAIFMLPRKAMEWPFFSSKWDAKSSLGLLHFGQENGIGQHFVGGENEMRLGMGEGVYIGTWEG